MTVTKRQKAKLGAFLLISGLLLVAAVVSLAGISLLDRKDQYTILFAEAVSGLDVGAPVKLRGVPVGSVVDISLTEEAVPRARVVVEVRGGTPIHRDATANLEYQGITGLKHVAIEVGTSSTELLKPGENIATGVSALGAITGKAEDITLKLEQVLNNLSAMTGPDNQLRVKTLLAGGQQTLTNIDILAQSLTQTSEGISTILKKNEAPARAVLKDASAALLEVTTLSKNLNGLTTDVRREVRAMPLADTVTDVRKVVKKFDETMGSNDLQQTLSQLNGALAAFRVLVVQATRTVQQNQDDVRATVHNLRRASDDLKSLSRAVRQQPSLILFDDPPQERAEP